MRPQRRTSRDLALLDLMLADMESAPDMFKPTNFWQAGLDHIVTDLHKHGIDTFRRHDSALTFYVPSYGADRKHRYIAKAAGIVSRRVAGKLRNDDLAFADYRVFLAADREGGVDLSVVTESTYGAPREQYVFGGKRYSRSLLNYLRGLALLKHAAPGFTPGIVMEIGGGYGTLGEILYQAAPGTTYLDVDIPPVGFVATRYLQHAVGVRAIVDYQQTRGLEQIALEDHKGQAVVVPPWELPKVVGKVDLFVNFISFQEMEPAVVANYAKYVTDLGAGYLLLRNSAHGKPIAPVGQVGVLDPVTIDTYGQVFPDFELIASDAPVFGEWTPRGSSEVMVFRRR